MAVFTQMAILFIHILMIVLDDVDDAADADADADADSFHSNGSTVLSSPRHRGVVLYIFSLIIIIMRLFKSSKLFMFIK